MPTNRGRPVDTTYYVSSLRGDDANDGTSPERPWLTLAKVNAIASTLGPGDRVLLERGSVFHGQFLHIHDTAGSEEAPILIGAYGDEAASKPRIDANGTGIWHQDYRVPIGSDGAPHRYHGDISSTILIKDVSHIRLTDLDIANDDPDVTDPIDTWTWTDKPDADGTRLDRSGTRMGRTGVAGIAENGSTMTDVTVENLTIHDVDGNLYDKHMANGGIMFMAHLPLPHTPDNDAWLKEHVSRFDRIAIRNNDIRDVDRMGLTVGYTAYLHYMDGDTPGVWQDGDANGALGYGDGLIDDGVIARFGATNVRIEGNRVTGAGSDAIVAMYCDRPLIQRNIADRAAKHINWADYTDRTGSARDEHGGAVAGRVAAAIWPWRCKNALLQYNQAYRTLNADHGNGDGQPWDADFGDGTVYQCNYSSGNSFATLMVCNEQAHNTTFRHNVAHDDNGALDLPRPGRGTRIHDNTFLLRAGARVVSARSEAGGTTIVENNYFVNLGDEPGSGWWNGEDGSADIVWKGNMCVNFADTPPDATGGEGEMF